MRENIRAVLLLAALCAVSRAAGGVPAADFERLVAKRDALIGALEKKPAAQEIVLRLDEGADRDDAWVTLRRTGNAWRTAFVEAPGWQQTTMKDWRGSYHGNFTYGCWRPNARYPAVADSLALDARRLGGALDVSYRLDIPTDERLPPGEYAQWWDRFIPGGHTVPRPMRYTIEANVRADACLLEMVLNGGVYWDSAFVSNPKNPSAARTISRQPIYLRFQAPGNRFSPVRVKTYTWVPGFHEAETAGLQFADGRLTGPLVVFLHQDGWGPWGGGKHTQHEPIVVRFELDARLERNELTGRYTASFGGELKGKSYNPRGDDSADVILPDTRYEGAISGRGGKLVTGRYAAKGAFGEQVGAVDGMLLDDARPAREQAGTAVAGATVENIGAVLHQTRALHLALQHEGMLYSDAWRQTDTASPALADAGEYLAAALRMCDALQDPAATLPPARAETVGDSPSFGVQAAPADTNGVNTLPPDAEGWLFMPRWSVLGPFEQRMGLEHDAAFVPDLVALPSAGYTQPADRYGLVGDRVRTQQWQAVSRADARLGAPWERAVSQARYVGQVWYGAATLRCEKARTVWLSLEANDFAKVWVNDRLVWADAERAWRYRPFGRAFVPVDLVSGDNRFLVRVHNDRNLSWLRLALSTREPATPAPASSLAQAKTGVAPAGDPLVFPEARPALAWDIARGTNVAWRNAALGGRTRPAVLGDAVFVTCGAGTLVCVDAASGAVRWSRDIDAAEQRPADRGRAGLAAAGAALSDGQRIVFVSGDGIAACFDPAGNRLWTQPTGMSQAWPRLSGTRLMVQGPVPDEGKSRGAAAAVRVLAYEMATGRETWRRDIPGQAGGGGAVLSAGGVGALLTCTGALLDSASGALLPALDCEMQLTGKDGAAVRDGIAGPYRMSAVDGRFILTSQTRHLAARLWERGGRLGSAQAWESNYGNSGFGNVGAPGVCTDAYLFTWHSSLAHTPHCPDPRAEVNVQDARDGRWIARLKPVLTDLYSYGPLNLSTPVVAGGSLFLLGGRADNSRNQIAIVSADDKIRLLARQDVEPGTTQPPVFSGERMFLRSPKSLLCVSAATPEGRRYERETLARTVLRVIGREPRVGKPREVAALERAAPAGEAPVGKFTSDRPSACWLGAGPFAPGSLGDAPALAALRPEAGGAFAGKTFAPLARAFAYNEPPAYLRTSELQGTGDITPRFITRVDPRCVSGPQGEGLLYTIIDNTRDRVVLPLLKGRGLSQWLGGVELNADEAVHLAPGLYPYLVKVAPEFYRAEEQEILAPVAVTNALARGAIRDIGWPKTWRVLGPLTVGTQPLTAAQLREAPETIAVDGQPCRLYPFAVDGQKLDLGCLVGAEWGEPPDLSSAFVRSAQPLSAYAFAAIECPADGYLYVTASCEASMCWYVDGIAVYDRLKEGNAASSADVNAHPFAVRVTRGRHVLAVQVRPGASGWFLLSAGGFSEQPADRMPEFRVESRLQKATPDFRLQPCFRELPYPPTLKRAWLERVRINADRLQAVVRDLPATPEARKAEAMLRSFIP